MRLRVSGDTLPASPRSAFETVDGLTPAALATSLMVTERMGVCSRRCGEWHSFAIVDGAGSRAEREDPPCNEACGSPTLMAIVCHCIASRGTFMTVTNANPRALLEAVLSANSGTQNPRL